VRPGIAEKSAPRTNPIRRAASVRAWSFAGARLICGAALLISGAALALLTPAASAQDSTVSAAPESLAIARIAVPQAMLAEKRGEIVFVDVRGSGQRAIGHIAHDIGIPIEKFAARLNELPRNRRLVFYCSCPAEELALEAARQMQAAGHSRVAVLVGGYDAWRAAGGAIAVDATWDEEFHVGDSPIGWGKTPEDSMHCRYARDREVAYLGKSSGRIECELDTTARGFAGLIQRIDAKTLRGRELTFSAMVRSEMVAPFGFLWVGAEDANGKMIAMHRAGTPIRGTTEWHAATVSGTVPEGAARVLVGINLAGQGGLWIDEAKLVASGAPGQPERNVPLKNPGFEQ
jgi:rhodanese-related sulfurtransferase